MINTAKLVGETIDDRYKVTDRLHLGGMGAVYKAVDTRLERDVVLKVPHSTLLAERGFAERFEREIRSLMKLEHPHIVKVLDAGMLDLVPFAVFQYLPGGSLLRRIQDGGAMTLEQVLGWLPPIGGALDFMHSKKLLHRDLKPSNLLFDESGNVIVADFGVVKSTDRTQGDLELTLKGQVPGSPEFMAPESIDTVDLTPAYDQYALGVTVYLALSGTLPASYDNPLEALVRRKPPQPLGDVAPGLPTEVHAAVMRALADKPEDRFATCGDFVAALQATPAADPPPAAAPTGDAGEFDAGQIVFDAPEAKGPEPAEPDPIPSLESSTIAYGAPPKATPTPTPTSGTGEPPARAVPGESATMLLDKPPSRKGTNKLLLVVVLLMCAVLVLVVAAKLRGGRTKRPVAGATVAPTITIVEPGPGLVTRASVVRVEGQVSDVAAQVTVEGRIVSVGADGWFHHDMDLLKDGEHTLDIVARNKAGQTGEASVTVRRDSKPPILRLPEVKERIVTRAATHTVTGRVDEGTTSVTVAGVVATLEDGAFTAEAPLTGEGKLTLAVVARDRGGNESTAEVVVWRDATAPSCEILFPPAAGKPYRTSEGVVDVRGRVDDAAARVTLAGTDVVLGSGNAFAVRVELMEAGEQEIAIVARDAAGNESRTAVRVYQETPLVIYEPRDGGTTGRAEVRVRGRVYGAGTAVTVNGAAVPTGAGGAFETTVALDGDGRHEVVVEARETSGEVTEAAMRLLRDSTPPTVTVSDPKGSVLTAAGSRVSVKGTVRDRNAVSVLINGREARILGDPAGGAEWVAQVALPMGTRALRVEAVDGAGNRSRVVTRTVLMQPPSFEGMERIGTNPEGFHEYALDVDKTVVLVLVPETIFFLGAAEGDPEARADEHPARRVRVGPFLIGKAPITWQQYLFFCAQTERKKPAVVGLPATPAVNLSWPDAMAYCEWANLRLPTESEWELAARGGDVRTPYPWGAAWEDAKANVEMQRGNTTPVGSYRWRNGFGLHDVVGNVWEWCADPYSATAYRGDVPRVNPPGPSAGPTRVLRGGSWRDGRAAARLSHRHHRKPDERADDVGFRVAR